MGGEDGIIGSSNYMGSDLEVDFVWRKLYRLILFIGFYKVVC